MLRAGGRACEAPLVRWNLSCPTGWPAASANEGSDNCTPIIRPAESCEWARVLPPPAPPKTIGEESFMCSLVCKCGRAINHRRLLLGARARSARRPAERPSGAGLIGAKGGSASNRHVRAPAWISPFARALIIQAATLVPSRNKVSSTAALANSRSGAIGCEKLAP